MQQYCSGITCKDAHEDKRHPKPKEPGSVEYQEPGNSQFTPRDPDGKEGRPGIRQRLVIDLADKGMEGEDFTKCRIE